MICRRRQEEKGTLSHKVPLRPQIVGPRHARLRLRVTLVPLREFGASSPPKHKKAYGKAFRHPLLYCEVVLRTCRYFAVWVEGQVVAVVHGYKQARLLSPCRAYRSFKNEFAATLFRDYWNNQVAVKFIAERRAAAEADYARWRGVSTRT